MTQTEETEETEGIETEHEWEYERGDVAREQDAKFGPTGEPDPKDEYRVERRLVDVDTGDQLFQVEKEEGGTHIFSEGVLNHRYEPISVEESRVWPKEGGDYFD